MEKSSFFSLVLSIIFFFNGNARVHVTWFFGQNFLVPLSATQHIRSPFPFFFAISTSTKLFFLLRQTPFETFSPTLLRKKTFLKRNCGKNTRRKISFFVFFFFFHLEIEAFARLWYAQPHTHTYIHTQKNKQTTQRNFENKRSRFSVACFLPWVERNHRVYTQKKQKNWDKNVSLLFRCFDCTC